LIQDVSGVLHPGETLLVLGSPGAGCSTLLRALASETETFVSVEGDVYYSSITSKEVQKQFQSEIIYNAEDDLHFPKLSVQNTLDFALQLRMPAKDSARARREGTARIRDRLLVGLGIAYTAKTIVGNAFVRGVSGGERKRVSLAEVLATNPAVACWDNPGRGLDSSSALQFLRLIKDISRSTGMVNIVTIYQAAESMYQDCFDNVLLLYKGRMIFYGRVEQAKQYFIDLGFECRPRQTTPDFLTGITSTTERSFRQDHSGPIPQTPDDLARVFRQSQEYRELQENIASYKSHHQIDKSYAEAFRQAANDIRSPMTLAGLPQPHSIISQIGAGIKRQYQLTWNDKSTLFTVLVLNAINAVITGSCFYKPPKTATGSYERGGAIFFSLLYFFLNALSETGTSMFARDIVVKQRKLGIMHPSAYVIAQTIADIPLQLVQTLIFTCCYYFMLGLNPTASQFWIFQLLVFVHYGAVCALYRFLGTVAPNISLAFLFAGSALPVGLTYSGFAPTTPTQHKWGSWIRRITPTPFALEALMGNEFYDITLQCSDTQMIPNGPSYENIQYQGCSIAGSVKGSPMVPGETYLELVYGFSRSHLWRNFGIILVFWFLYTVFSAVAISFTARETGHSGGLVFKRGAKTLEDSQTYKTSSDLDGDLEKQTSRVSQGVGRSHETSANSSAETLGTHPHEMQQTSAHEQVVESGSTFTFQDVNYYVNVDGGERQLLSGVSGYARPGQLTALMGASGAGKTTLLDTISQRKAEGRIEASMLLNGLPLDPSFGRSCGFCMQQDVHEPLTTVRESLQFSAHMRQPAETDHAEKMQYVEHIIGLLELNDIADAMVGGLGVEERKRITIGVELAAKPSALLFLDEPTSGLDSQAAFSIVRFLRKIAAEGLPIVCTIHQPSSVLFEMFDHILLLAPGGRTIYFGETNQKLIDYFGRHDAQMSSDDNPAEFMISTTSGDQGSVWHDHWLQSPERADLDNKLKVMIEQPMAESKHNRVSDSRRFALPLQSQVIALTRRHWISVWRDGRYNFSKTFKSIWCEIFIAFTFYNVGSDIQGLQNYVLSVLILIWVVQALAPDIQTQWYAKWSIFEAREKNGIYDYRALTTALIAVEVPWQIMNFTLIFFVSYWTVGYPNSSTIAGYSYFIWLLISYFGTTWNQLVSAVFPNMQTSGFANSLFWNILMIFSGTLVPHASLNTFYRYWLYWLDPVRWFLGGHVEDTLHGVQVQCRDSDLTIFDPRPGQTCAEYAADFLSTATGYLSNPSATSNCGYCVYSTGDDYAATMDYSYDKRWRDLGLCIVFCFTNTVLIYLATWYKHGRVRKAT
jgi:ATP-binding cassette subfamily G (WHITE) protein 2 (SNQ2)